MKLKGNYFKPTDEELLEGNDKMRGYVASIHSLTINEENRLKKQLVEKDYIIAEQNDLWQRTITQLKAKGLID